MFFYLSNFLCIKTQRSFEINASSPRVSLNLSQSIFSSDKTSGKRLFYFSICEFAISNDEPSIDLDLVNK
jgi:hypothetical protein